LEIVDENSLKQTIEPVIQQFKKDLRATHAEVVNAKKALKKLARSLSTLNPPDTINENSQSDKLEQ